MKPSLSPTPPPAPPRGAPARSRSPAWPRSRPRRARAPPTPARRASAATGRRRSSSSTPRRAATRARRPTAGCRSSKADPSVVALAFHVDYWDRLGWKDRFASAAFTARQAEQQASNGARFSYTPQVVVDGRDRTDWPGIARAARRPPGRRAVDVPLAREGDRVIATVTPARRRAEAARRLLGGHRAGPRHRRQGRRERRRDAAARLRGARLPDRCRPGRRAPARRRRSASSCRRRADAAAHPRERQPGRRRRRQRPAGAGAEARLLSSALRSGRGRSAARSAARSSAPISGLPANGSVGLRACTTSSSRVCTLPSALRMAVDVEAVLRRSRRTRSGRRRRR